MPCKTCCKQRNQGLRKMLSGILKRGRLIAAAPVRKWPKMFSLIEEKQETYTQLANNVPYTPFFQHNFFLTFLHSWQAVWARCLRCTPEFGSISLCFLFSFFRYRTWLKTICHWSCSSLGWEWVMGNESCTLLLLKKTQNCMSTKGQRIPAWERRREGEARHTICWHSAWEGVSS